jgi:uncharacterized protein (TIGR00162 family)
MWRRNRAGLEVIRFIEKPELQRPILVVGLPGSGLVGKLAVDHLITEFGGRLLTEIYSNYFPPQVLIRPDGSSTLFRNELHYLYVPDLKRHFLVYTGDAQPQDPQGQYLMADRVLQIAQELGADSLWSLAAYITGGFSGSPAVYGTATDKELLRDLLRADVKLMTEGTISGVNGLVIGLAKLRGMKGYCLLGETSGYIVDAGASEAVLRALSKILGFSINLTKLQDRARETAAIIKVMSEMQRRREAPVEREKAGRDLGYIS